MVTTPYLSGAPCPLSGVPAPIPSGLTTEQLIYSGRAEGWLIVPGLEPL